MHNRKNQKYLKKYQGVNHTIGTRSISSDFPVDAAGLNNFFRYITRFEFAANFTLELNYAHLVCLLDLYFRPRSDIRRQ